MGKRQFFHFANKHHSVKGIISTVFGAAAALILVILVVISIKLKGNAGLYAGSLGLVAFILACIGCVNGIMSYKEEDSFRLFSLIGIILNTLIVIAGLFLYLSGLRA